MRSLLPIIVAITLLSAFSSNAQIVGTDCFLQGAWVEVGINQMGGFGTCSSPATYHSHPCCGATTTFTPGIAMDMSYDWGHDGWGTGSPALMGPYSQPGYPQEGWSLQIGATEYRNGAWGGLCSGEYDVPGTIVGYSNAGGRLINNWEGGVGGIDVKQETRIDTFASWIVMTAKLYNTTSAPITDIYFERTLDPDNVSFWGGGATTRNRIVHQNEDASNRVMVSANGERAASGSTPAYDSINSYLALAAKDCRAKCGYLASGLSPSTTPASLWALPTTGGAIGEKGSNNLRDVGIWIAFRIGTIAAGDSAVVAYAYVFDSSKSIDSALRDPVLAVEDVPFPPMAAAPTPEYDTILGSDYPGIPTVTVDIWYGDEGAWTWADWTWAPATGLSATTGTSVDVTFGSLSGPTTYTITGSNTGTGGLSCDEKIIYLTVIPDFRATSNSPDTSRVCVDDTLKLRAHGDSTGASYVWYGPTIVGPLRGFTQYVDIPHITMADTGWYYVIKTVGAVSDTTETHVLFKPKPVITATYNAPLCSGNTLLLYSSPDSVGETWVWTGPDGFTSTLSDPGRPFAPTSYSGPYTVVATFGGCVDSSIINVVVDSTPAVPTVSSNSFICEGDTIKLFADCVTPAITYSWAGPSGYTSFDQNPVIPVAPLTANGTYTVTVTRGTCTNSATIDIDVRPTPVPTLGSNSPVCSGTPLNLTTTAPAGSTFDWTGPLAYTSGLQFPTIDPAITANSGTYSVVVTLNGCASDMATITVVVDSTPETPTISSNSPGVPGPTLCEGDTLKLYCYSGSGGVGYEWGGPSSFTSTEANPVIVPATPAASGVYSVVVSLGACSVTASTTATITPTPLLTVSSNSPVCSGDGDSILLTATSNPGAVFNWTGPYTFFSAAQDPIRTPVSTEYGGVYHVTAFFNGCYKTLSHTVVVNPTPSAPWVKWLTYCQYYDAPYLQAVGDNLLWYSSADPTGTSTPEAPKPQTDAVGVTYYYVNQTVENCTSAMDSIRVKVDPTPTVTVSKDRTVCPRDSVILTAVNTDAVAYFRWYPDMYLSDTAGAVVIARPETDTKYKVVTSNMYNCTDTAYVSLTVKADAVISLEDSVTLYPGENYQIEPATNCTQFSWTPSGGLSAKFVSNPLASPVISTKYVVTGVTEWGCLTKDSISINVNTEAVLTLPNAFAPGRGINDKFKVIRRGLATLRYFRVYNRWGNLMFETTNIDEGWDGTLNGKPQPVGVYVYEVSAVSKSGTVFKKQGNVTLLR